MDCINTYIGGIGRGKGGSILSLCKDDLKDIVYKINVNAMDINKQTDFKNLNGKVKSCLTPKYLSGAGKPAESVKQNAKVIGMLGIGSSYLSNDPFI